MTKSISKNIKTRLLAQSEEAKAAIRVQDYFEKTEDIEDLESQ
jgi:hypothetical protein